MSMLKRLPLNKHGRDFVVGDIHGCYEPLKQALKAVGFDVTKDRLFSVGDLVDRGPESPRALKFLAQPWVHAIRGNHEDMFLELYADGEPDEDILRIGTRRNGMSWWMDIDKNTRKALIEAFRRLPIAIEVETKRGLVGLVHAEVPHGMSWQDFTRKLNDRHVVNSALWSRVRVSHGDISGVQGISRVFVGHTPLQAPERLGNVIYIDTGAVFGMLKGQDPKVGRMTLADITAEDAVFDISPSYALVDIRMNREPTCETEPHPAP